MSKPLTFTREGFPKPDSHAEYRQNDVVWALIDPNMPYWPAQIKIGGTVFSTKKQPTTKELKKVPIITFNDPALSIVLNEDKTISEKSKKRKKDLSKHRRITRSKLLPWDAKKKDGAVVQFEDVLAEFIKRKKLKNEDQIDASIWTQWNDIAIDAAEDELNRLYDLQKLEKKRKFEQAELEKARRDEVAIAKSMIGQKYDGRKKHAKTGKLMGWRLKAGDWIRYWAKSKMSNENILIKTQIIRLGNKYETEKAQDHVPIDVQINGNPPFWQTEIEKLPSKNPLHPTYYPLRQCLFIPSQIENIIETQHMKQHDKFNKDLQKKGWGGMLYANKNNNNNNKYKNKNNNNNNNNNIVDMDSDSDSDVDMEQPKVKQIEKNTNKSNKAKTKTKRKRKRKRKRRLSDDDDDDDYDYDYPNTDSDIQILNSNSNNKECNNIINGRKSLKLRFDNKHRKQKKCNLDAEYDKNQSNIMEPRKKKRRLNNPKQSEISITAAGLPCGSLSSESESEGDLVLFKDIKHKQEQQEKEKEKEKEQEDEEYEDPIPFPPAKPVAKQNNKRKNKKKNKKKKGVLNNLPCNNKNNNNKKKKKKQAKTSSKKKNKPSKLSTLKRKACGDHDDSPKHSKKLDKLIEDSMTSNANKNKNKKNKKNKKNNKNKKGKQKKNEIKDDVNNFKDMGLAPSVENEFAELLAFQQELND